jgi:DGQHR domain-containing protein
MTDAQDSKPSVITCRCLEIAQPIGSFYIAVLASSDVVDISYADIRLIESGGREIESISGIQRNLSPKRVDELAKYVNTMDASFPTGIILAMSSEDVDYDAEKATLTIQRHDRVAKIIDGQHRIQGLRSFNGETFQVNVTIFIDMEIEYQAILFSTINLKQTPVNKSLVYDLYEYAEARGPQKTCHLIARLLNRTPGNPFERRIMILGTATGSAKESLTQAAFIEPLLKLISRDPMTDRDLFNRNRKPKLADDSEVRAKNLVFRNWFIDDKDAMIAATISNYFQAITTKWTTAWDMKQRGLILNRTTGYRALMRFLPLTLFTLGLDTLHTVDEFFGIIDRVNLIDDDFTPDNFKPGSSGEGALFRRLIANTGIQENAAWKGLKPKA